MLKHKPICDWRIFTGIFIKSTNLYYGKHGEADDDDDDNDDDNDDNKIGG